MNAPNCEIVIPGAIAALPLKANHKIVLSHVLENPKCRNRTLAKLVGASERYIKTVLRRLLSDGLLQQTGKGRARKLYLNFHVEQGTACLVPDRPVSSKNREPRAQFAQVTTSTSPATIVPKVQLSLADDFEETMRTVAQMTATRDFFPETIIRLLEPLIRRIETEMYARPEKEEILRDLRSRHAAFLAVCMATKWPKEFQQELDRRLSHATSVQLLRLREFVQARQLGHATPLMLTDALSGT